MCTSSPARALLRSHHLVKLCCQLKRCPALHSVGAATPSRLPTLHGTVGGGCMIPWAALPVCSGAVMHLHKSYAGRRKSQTGADGQRSWSKLTWSPRHAQRVDRLHQVIERSLGFPPPPPEPRSQRRDHSRTAKILLTQTIPQWGGLATRGASWCPWSIPLRGGRDERYQRDKYRLDQAASQSRDRKLNLPTSPRTSYDTIRYDTIRYV